MNPDMSATSSEELPQPQPWLQMTPSREDLLAELTFKSPHLGVTSDLSLLTDFRVRASCKGLSFAHAPSKITIKDKSGTSDAAGFTVGSPVTCICHFYKFLPQKKNSSAQEMWKTSLCACSSLRTSAFVCSGFSHRWGPRMLPLCCAVSGTRGLLAFCSQTLLHLQPQLHRQTISEAEAKAKSRLTEHNASTEETLARALELILMDVNGQKFLRQL